MTATIVPKQQKAPTEKKRRAVPKNAATAQRALRDLPAEKPTGGMPLSAHALAEPPRLIPVELIHPHPLNQPRDPEPLVASIREHGIRVPCQLRTCADLPAGHFQAIAGHRRIEAAKRAGLAHVPAWVAADLDDAAALVLLHADNAEREDLTDLQKAAALRDLTRPIDEQGAGLTIEQAGQRYQLSRPAASNLMRLLELPEVWQQRMNAGELRQTIARDFLLPLVQHPALVSAVEEWFSEPPTAYRPPFHELSRGEFAEELHQCLADVSRLFCTWDDPRRLSEVELKQVPAETQAELGLFAIPEAYTPGEKDTYAANCQLYDQLVAAKPQGKKKPGLNASSRPLDDEPAAAELTPAEAKAAEREKRAKRKAQLGRNLDEWVDRLLRWGLAQQFKAPAGSPDRLRRRQESALRLLIFRASCQHTNWKRTGDIEQAIAAAQQTKVNGASRTGEAWSAIEGLPISSTTEVAYQLLHPKLIDHLLESHVRDGLCQALGVTRESAWLEAVNVGEGMLLIDEWLALHTKSELLAIAADWGVEAAASIKGKDLLERLGEHVEQNGEGIPLPAELVVKKKISRKGAKARRKA